MKPNAKADPARRVQSPVFEPKGSTATGIAVPTPYLSDLPCITDCVPTEIPAHTTYPTHRPIMKAAAAKCTGMPGAVGVVGIGLLAGAIM